MQQGHGDEKVQFGPQYRELQRHFTWLQYAHQASTVTGKVGIGCLAASSAFLLNGLVGKMIEKYLGGPPNSFDVVVDGARLFGAGCLLGYVGICGRAKTRKLQRQIVSRISS